MTKYNGLQDYPNIKTAFGLFLKLFGIGILLQGHNVCSFLIEKKPTTESSN